MEILAGNHDNLKEFKKHFKRHDQKTLDIFWRRAVKKEGMIVIRRIMPRGPQIPVIIVPYSVASKKGEMKDIMNFRFAKDKAYITNIPLDTKTLFVFGERIPRLQTSGFVDAIKKRKRKPFEKHPEAQKGDK